MDLWWVDGSRLLEVPAGHVDVEERLEDWIYADPALLGMELLMIGRQVVSPHGGRIDLLALDEEGNTVVLELKRGRTSREVVAQVLDYASWVRDLSYDDLDRICRKHKNLELAAAFRERFDHSLPEAVNDDHQLVIVAPELDDSSERIVTYLAEERDLPINVVFFNVFTHDGREFLGRAWLRDPGDMDERTGSKRRAPWPGYWFVNVGEGIHRRWTDNERHGFVGAGQGEKYSKPLRNLGEGDEIFAYVKGRGYVGYGVVTGEAEPIKDVRIKGKPLLELPLDAPRPEDHSEDPRMSEWVVRVDWKRTFPVEEARTFKGVFANQNIVCKLRDPTTVTFLRREFGLPEES